MNKRLGKIVKASFGFGGYQEAMIGITFELESDGFHVTDFKGYWSTKRMDTAQWSEEDRLKSLGSTCMEIADLLSKAKVSSVEELAGTPIEVTTDLFKLKEWRVLTEVL